MEEGLKMADEHPHHYGTLVKDIKYCDLRSSHSSSNVWSDYLNENTRSYIEYQNIYSGILA